METIFIGLGAMIVFHDCVIIRESEYWIDIVSACFIVHSRKRVAYSDIIYTCSFSPIGTAFGSLTAFQAIFENDEDDYAICALSPNRHEYFPSVLAAVIRRRSSSTGNFSKNWLNHSLRPSHSVAFVRGKFLTAVVPALLGSSTSATGFVSAH